MAHQTPPFLAFPALTNGSTLVSCVEAVLWCGIGPHREGTSRADRTASAARALQVAG
jgi:hypothetical protein